MHTYNISSNRHSTSTKALKDKNLGLSAVNSAPHSSITTHHRNRNNRYNVDSTTSRNQPTPSAYHTCTHHHNNPQAQSTSDQSCCRTTPYPRSCCTPAKCGPSRPLARRMIVQLASTRNLPPLSVSGQLEEDIINNHTFHGVASLPLELCRIAAELEVRSEDEGNIS
jgi:hypothetical protein